MDAVRSTHAVGEAEEAAVVAVAAQQASDAPRCRFC